MFVIPLSKKPRIVVGSAFFSKKSNKERNEPLWKINNMRREYNFSKGERGKFFRPNARIHLPIYLDEERFKFVEKIAKEKK